MKKVFKIIAIVVAILSVVTFALIGILQGKNNVSNTESDLEIVYWEAGNGRQYLDLIIAAFNKKYPEINVHLTSTAEVLNEEIYASNQSCTVDLFFTSFEEALAYSEFLEPMDDILEMEVDGNGVKIKDKMDNDVLNSLRNERGELYTIPYSNSINGLIYNVTEFENNNYNIPQTTNDLINLALTMYSDGETPFIHYPEYWRYLYEVWVAQYEGLETYNNYLKGIYTDSENVKHYNDVRIITESVGRNAAYNVMYELVSPRGYTYNNTNALTHTTSQTYFLNNRAMMIPCGSWIENEMKSSETSFEMKLMKVPVISSLGTKLGITENQLKAAISYVDGETLTNAQQQVIDGLSQEIIEKVRSARSLVYTEQPNYSTIIPNYAVGKEAAKKFVGFYFSDEALKIAANTNNLILSAKLSTNEEINTTSWSNFAKNNYELSKNATYVYSVLNNKLFYDGGINKFYKYNPVIQMTYGYDAITVENYIELEKNYWESNWNNILRNAGIVN